MIKKGYMVRKGRRTGWFREVKTSSDDEYAGIKVIRNRKRKGLRLKRQR